MALATFLERLSQEHGWVVRYADPTLASDASGIVLHGSVTGLTVHEALEIATTTSGLRHRLENGELMVFQRTEREETVVVLSLAPRRAVASESPRLAGLCVALVIAALGFGAPAAGAHSTPTGRSGSWGIPRRGASRAAGEGTTHRVHVGDRHAGVARAK